MKPSSWHIATGIASVPAIATPWQVADAVFWFTLPGGFRRGYTLWRIEQLTALGWMERRVNNRFAVGSLVYRLADGRRHYMRMRVEAILVDGRIRAEYLDRNLRRRQIRQAEWFFQRQELEYV